MYSRENYRLLISHIIDAGYQFNDFTDASPTGTKHAFLLHNIAWNVRSALELAKENHELGVLGTFFFEFRSARYNLMAYRDEIASIHALGQKIGFFYNAKNRHHDDENPLTGIKKEFEEFLEIVPNAQPVFWWPSMREKVQASLKDHSTLGMKSIYDPEFHEGVLNFVDMDIQLEWKSKPSCPQRSPLPKFVLICPFSKRHRP